LRDDHYTVILNLKKENGEEINYFNPYFDADRMAKDLPIIRAVSLANDGSWTQKFKYNTNNMADMQHPDIEEEDNICGYCILVFLHNRLNLGLSFSESTDYYGDEEKPFEFI